MNLTKSLLLVSTAALFAMATPAVRAQAATSPAFRGGLLGQTYSGIEAGYVRHHESAPRVMRRYGFISSRPMPDGENLDGRFRYNYTRGSTLGTEGQQHDFSIGVSRFFRNGPVAPFLEGDLGWGWARGGGRRANSFIYQAKLGVETMLSTDVSLTPSISYQEARQFHDHTWNFGLKLAYRLNEGWATTLGTAIDDANNVEIALGVHRRL